MAAGDQAGVPAVGRPVEDRAAEISPGVVSREADPLEVAFLVISLWVVFLQDATLSFSGFSKSSWVSPFLYLVPSAPDRHTPCVNTGRSRYDSRAYVTEQR